MTHIKTGRRGGHNNLYEGELAHEAGTVGKVPLSPTDRLQKGSRAGVSLSNLRDGKLSSEDVKGVQPPPPEVVRAALSKQLVKKAHIDSLLNSAFGTLARELDRLYMLSLDEGLTPTQTQQYERLVKALKMLAQEEREQIAADKLDDLTDKDLIAKAAHLLGQKDEK